MHPPSRYHNQSKTLVMLNDEAEQCRLIAYLNECSYPSVGARTEDEVIPLAVEAAMAVINVDSPERHELVRGLRRYRPELVIITVASTANDDLLVEMLGLGVEDHMVHPYDLEVLVWRVNAVHSARLGIRPSRMHDVRLEEGTRTLRYHGRTTRLTPSEFRLVSVLASRPGFIFERKDVIRHVWGKESMNGDRAVDALVSRVRKRLEREVGLHGETIRTVRGLGYQFERRQTARDLSTRQDGARS